MKKIQLAGAESRPGQTLIVGDCGQEYVGRFIVARAGPDRRDARIGDKTEWGPGGFELNFLFGEQTHVISIDGVEEVEPLELEISNNMLYRLSIVEEEPEPEPTPPPPPPRDVLWSVRLGGNIVSWVQRLFDTLALWAEEQEGWEVEQTVDPTANRMYCVINVYEALMLQDYAPCFMNGWLALWLDSNKPERKLSLEVLELNMELPDCLQVARLKELGILPE